MRITCVLAALACAAFTADLSAATLSLSPSVSLGSHQAISMDPATGKYYRRSSTSGSGFTTTGLSKKDL